MTCGNRGTNYGWAIGTCVLRTPLEGRRYLSAAAMAFLSTPQTGNLPTGFFQNETYGNRGTNYGWGIGTCVLRTPHEGVAEMLSPGSYGHGGAWGTQRGLTRSKASPTS